MPEPSFSTSLISMLDTLAAPARFSRIETPPADVSRPEALKIWVSDFAVLALVGVPEAGADSLDQAFIQSNGWISRLLKVEEKKGRLIDGYLLFAMPSKPDESLLAQVRRVESDTRVCRKHVLWPDADGSWLSSVYAVTTLGLPSAETASDQVTEPILSWVALKALAARENGQPFEDVASYIEELPLNESERS